MKRINLKICLLILFFITFSNNFTMPGEKLYDMAELVNISKFIVYGKVISINSYKSENGWILSDIKIQISKNFKGKMKINQVLSFTVIGGTLGSRTTMVLVYPHFTAKQESILFLNQVLDDTQLPNAFLITGMTQGKFDIIKDEQNNQQIIRDKFMSSQIDIKVGTGNKILNDKQTVLLSEFVAHLESLIK